MKAHGYERFPGRSAEPSHQTLSNYLRGCGRELHRISVRVVEYNARALRACQKCGFVIEGREREAALVDGAWYDDVMKGLLDREYRR